MQLRGCLAESNPDTLGQRLPNRGGGKKYLCIVSKEKSSSKTHVLRPISSRVSVLSHKPAVLLPLQYVFSYSLHIAGLMLLPPQIYLLSSKFKKKFKPEYIDKSDRGMGLHRGIILTCKAITNLVPYV